MFNLEVDVKNFLSVKEATLISKNNITILIAPNKAGKTQLMQLLYSFFWSLWIRQKNKEDFSSQLDKKIKNVFLVRNKKDLISWGEKEGFCRIFLEKDNIACELYYPLGEKNYSFNQTENRDMILIKSPIYMQLSGLGDHYKGIYSLKKYYPNWKLMSEAITDLLADLFIVESEKVEIDEKDERLLNLFEKFFDSKFYIQNDRIYIQEKNKKYGIEKTASGLKSLSWLYLIVKYNLVGDIIFIDEPEVNLHPLYIDKLTYFLYELSKNRKLFVATHSDYLLESFNKLIVKHNLRIDVWEGDLERNGTIYTSYESNKDNLIDTTPLNETYSEIIKELFEYEGDINIKL